MNKKIIGMVVLIILMLLSNSFLILRITALKKSVNSLEEKTEKFEKSLIEFQEKQEIQISKINDGINSVLDRQEENKTEIKADLVKINRKSDAQFSKTVGMSKTYDAILEEQKKKTIDTAEKDREFIDAKVKAYNLYKKGNFAESYSEYKRLVELDAEDMECRSYKLKSLYYMNKADSSNHTEILEDIKILKLNAKTDDECLEIEKAILTEKEGFNE